MAKNVENEKYKKLIIKIGKVFLDVEDEFVLHEMGFKTKIIFLLRMWYRLNIYDIHLLMGTPALKSKIYKLLIFSFYDNIKKGDAKHEQLESESERFLTGSPGYVQFLPCSGNKIILIELQ